MDEWVTIRVLKSELEQIEEALIDSAFRYEVAS